MIRLIVNPIAGNGKAKIVGELADDYLVKKQIEHSVVYTRYAGHATELARQAVEEGVQSVVAIGGDGTVSETAAGMVGSRVPLGILSAGTGNDFIKALGLPGRWQAALEFILTHCARPVDAGMMNETFFLNVCGMGFDVMVLDYALHAKKYVRGIWPYLYGVIRAVKNYQPALMHIEIGQECVLDGKYMICSIANGRFIGGGIPIAPVADVSDGEFDLVVVDAVSRWKIPFYLPGLLSGKLLKYKIAHHYRTKTCVLSAPGMRLNIDGEILPVEHTSFTCQKDALYIYW